MPIDLKQLLDPAHTAVLVMECQEGIVGGGAALGALGEAVQRHGTIAQIARVLDAARAARVPIFYLTVARRADSAARTANCLLLALGRKGEPLLPGSKRQAVVDALAPREGDWVRQPFPRRHAVPRHRARSAPAQPRRENRRRHRRLGQHRHHRHDHRSGQRRLPGRHPKQAVTGTPDDYVEAVFTNTLRLLATVATVDDVVAAWQ